jgi:hypothetical protein
MEASPTYRMTPPASTGTPPPIAKQREPEHLRRCASLVGKAPPAMGLYQDQVQDLGLVVEPPAPAPLMACGLLPLPPPPLLAAAEEAEEEEEEAVIPG